MALLPQKVEFPIQGMTCDNCAQRIERALKKTAGVLSVQVSYSTGRALIRFDPDQVQPRVLIASIEKLGYQVLPSSADPKRKVLDFAKVMGILVGLIILVQIWNALNLSTLFNNFPLAEQGMGYGVLFLVGLLTSVHCIAMCGAINLSACTTAQSTSRGASLSRSFQYNLGRVIAYTVIGALVGGLGSIIAVTGQMRGVVIGLSGLFMILMGINLLGLFPRLSRFVPHLPKILGQKIHLASNQSGNRPLIIGLLNGLMPCGPLQAMQLYALATGSWLTGALSMFVFSLGTVPLMFTLGAMSTLLTQKFSRTMIRVSSIIIVVLGLFMVQNGLNLTGLTSSASAGKSTGEVALSVESSGNSADNLADDTVQLVRTDLQPNAYEPITVQAGKPVRWIITASKSTLNGCNRELYIPEYDLTKRLEIGENVIEFTPTQSGVYPFSCWMGMINSQITVVDP